MSIITILGEKKEYANGTTFEEIAKEYQKQFHNTIALVTENGKIRELYKEVSKDAELDFITLSSPIGHKTYERSAIMLLVKAVHDVMGDKVRIKVEFSIGKGVYCAVIGEEKLTEEEVKKIYNRMNELVEKDIPIIKKPYHVAEAIEIFENAPEIDNICVVITPEYRYVAENILLKNR